MATSDDCNIPTNEWSPAARDVYMHSKRGYSRDHDLAFVAAQSPRATICLLSALWFHNLAVLHSRVVWIAVERSAQRPRSPFPPLRVVLEQLAGLGAVTSRRMFGGAGLYCDEQFFGLIFGDTLYLKANDSNRGDYVARGMNPFRPYAGKPQVSMSYYEVPPDVLEDGAQLVAWARRSTEAAATTPQKRSRRKR